MNDELKAPPGPKGHPIFGLIDNFRRDMLGFYRTAMEEYGDVVRLRLLWINTYAVTHPDAVRYILQEHNRNYRRNRFVNDLIKRYLGKGLFTLDGESWLSRRRLMQPAFHRQQLQGMTALMTAATEQMLATWDDHPAGQPLAIEEEMTQVTLRIAGQALFRVDLLGEAKRVGDAFVETTSYTSKRMQTPFLPPRFLPTAQNRRFQRATQMLDQTIYAMIRERRRRAAGQERSTEAMDLLTMLMTARDEETGATMSDEQLRHEIALLIFAGHDTTANALTWTFYLLSQHPVAEARLHAELDTVLQGRTPTIADLPQLPYTRMVIEESLRLYPPAWTIGRQSIAADCVGGYQLPAQANLIIPIYVIHRDPRWWPDPDRFDPERFSPEASAGRHKFAY
ncbi:MAG: cytochrome P450, partial [Caldilineaceae bacterium]|nr:cytochrome P450 [Caldilineaceae bacterium]